MQTAVLDLPDRYEGHPITIWIDRFVVLHSLHYSPVLRRVQRRHSVVRQRAGAVVANSTHCVQVLKVGPFILVSLVARTVELFLVCYSHPTVG